MTKNKRITVSLPPNLEQMLYGLRKTDQFCRMSYSEILQKLFEKGASEILNPPAPASPAPPEPDEEYDPEWEKKREYIRARMKEEMAKRLTGW